MKNTMWKTTVREIRQSLGRFLAILAIVALGVGLFAGLKVTKPLIIQTMEDYLEEKGLYDLRLLSSYGITQEELEELAECPGASTVQGSFTYDMLYEYADEEEIRATKVHSLTKGMNELQVLEGRLPETAEECVVDSRLYGSDAIGQTIRLSAENEEETLENFACTQFTIVGVAQSSYYIQFERGNTSLGTGKLDSFLYVAPEAFDSEIYTEAFVKLEQSFPLYSEEYKAYAEEEKELWETYLQTAAQKRFQRIVEEAETELLDARQELEPQKEKLAEAEQELKTQKETLLEAEQELESQKEKLQGAEKELSAQKEMLLEAEQELESQKEMLLEAEQELAVQREKLLEAEQELESAERDIAELDEPVVYVLGRDTNVGYVCLENDSNIVADVADVFPVFFFLVAALVCMTTMNRMIEEQRTQIGVWKALGYSNAAIMGKYLFYSGSAALIGCISGFLVGTLLFPKVIWYAYGMMYDGPALLYKLDVVLAVISLAVSLLCSMGVTWYSCRVELSEVAAALMRPKAPRAGKRIFLEKIPFLWKRLKFLQKVSLRNVLRYKKRFFMMIVGISGCTALLVAAFGIQDSIADVVQMQYQEIQLYDMSVTFTGVPDGTEYEELETLLADGCEAYSLFMEGAIDIQANGLTKDISFIIPQEPENITKYLDMHTNKGEDVTFPQEGEAVLTHKLAGDLQVKVGDTIELTDDNHNVFTVTVSGISQNFIYNYVYLHPDTCTRLWKEPEYKTVYMKLSDKTDAHLLSADIMKLENIASVTINADVQERFEGMMGSMNYIVFLIILCAAALAFIVLYNLTNINITERIREIATIKVLGFYKKETASYVFRENIILTTLGALVGLLLGKGFHAFVMSCINIELIAFDVRIKGISYGYSLLLTLLFAGLVNSLMAGKLEKISMTESLKSVD